MKCLVFMSEIKFDLTLKKKKKKKKSCPAFLGGKTLGENTVLNLEKEAK